VAATDTATAPADADSTAPVHARSTVHPGKAAAVAEIAESFRRATAAVLTEYRGLSVKQITALRVALGADTSYSVVKNTLTRLAAADAGLDGLQELLQGPTAVAFVNGDPVEAAKGLRDYARANPQLVVKGGVLDGKSMTADEIRRLADLESRDVLLAKLAGAMLASLSQAVYLLNAPLAQAARLAAALHAKAEQDPSVIGGAGTPAADAPGAAPDVPDPDGATAVGSSSGRSSSGMSSSGMSSSGPDEAAGSAASPAAGETSSGSETPSSETPSSETPSSETPSSETPTA